MYLTADSSCEPSSRTSSEFYAMTKTDFPSKVSHSPLHKKRKGILGHSKGLVVAIKHGMQRRLIRFREECREFGPVGGVVYGGLVILVVLLWIPVLILAFPLILLVALFFGGMHGLSFVERKCS